MQGGGVFTGLAAVAVRIEHFSEATADDLIVIGVCFLTRTYIYKCIIPETFMYALLFEPKLRDK